VPTRLAAPAGVLTRPYTRSPLRVSRGIRAVACTLVAAGVAAPLLRRRVRIPAPAVLGAAWLAPVAVCVLVRPSRTRQVAVCVLNMWAYIASYEMPHDDPEGLARRARIEYPIVADRVLGLGVLPTVRLQRTFSRPGKVRRFERLLAMCHWIWFVVPHASLGYVLLRRGERLPRAAARMYAVFDIGAVFYWAIPTAPPWWAATHRQTGHSEQVQVRRMMIEYGPVFWGPLWEPLFGMLGGNPLAAMPSLHFATSLMGAHLLSEVDPVAGAVGWTYAGMLGLGLVYLGEHYLVDLVAGAVLTETVRAAGPRMVPLGRRWIALLDGLQAQVAAG
jgi:membrane-associated phospholipid phosphatase